MARAGLDFWFTSASTYTYLTVGRYEALARAADVEVRLRPIRSVGALTGATQLPFLEGTAKMAHMRRDIERRAARHGLPVRVPFPYPAPDVGRANAVAMVGVREGWGAAYLREAYRLWFAEGIGNGSEANLRRTFAAIGLGDELARILALAASEEVGSALAAETAEARRLGVFGSPSFVVRGEVFWGDDRLEDAIEWALHGRLRAAPVPSAAPACQ